MHGAVHHVLLLGAGAASVFPTPPLAALLLCKPHLLSAENHTCMGLFTPACLWRLVRFPPAVYLLLWLVLGAAKTINKNNDNISYITFIYLVNHHVRVPSAPRLAL